jgi:hypothetical protein
VNKFTLTLPGLARSGRQRLPLTRRERDVQTSTDNTKKKPEFFAYHTSAAGLILCAAHQSGLLKSVAEMLLAKAKYAEEGIHVCDCTACELLQRLTDAFDEPSLLPGDVWSEFYGGSDIPTYPKEELAPYLNKPALSEIPA